MGRNTRVFALGMKGYIEIREAKEPPKVEVSKTIKVVREWVPRYDPWELYYKEIPRKIKLKSIVFLGGRVLTTIKTRRFTALLKISIREGGILELTPEMISRLEVYRGQQKVKTIGQTTKQGRAEA